MKSKSFELIEAEGKMVVTTVELMTRRRKLSKDTKL
jgi:hypothetical protein